MTSRENVSLLTQRRVLLRDHVEHYSRTHESVFRRYPASHLQPSRE
jgi:hypothetical protein